MDADPIQRSIPPLWQSVLAKRSGCGHTNFWNVRSRSDGVLLAEVDDSWGGVLRNYAGLYTDEDGAYAPVNDDTFHHIAFVREVQTSRIFVDGDLEFSETTTGITNLNNTVRLVAGRTSYWCHYYGERDFKGMLDEVTIYNRALAVTEIQDIFETGSEGKCKPSP